LGKFQQAWASFSRLNRLQQVSTGFGLYDLKKIVCAAGDNPELTVSVSR